MILKSELINNSKEDSSLPSNSYDMVEEFIKNPQFGQAMKQISELFLQLLDEKYFTEKMITESDKAMVKRVQMDKSFIKNITTKKNEVDLLKEMKLFKISTFLFAILQILKDTQIISFSKEGKTTEDKMKEMAKKILNDYKIKKSMS